MDSYHLDSSPCEVQVESELPNYPATLFLFQPNVECQLGVGAKPDWFAHELLHSSFVRFQPWSVVRFSQPAPVCLPGEIIPELSQKRGWVLDG
jgi:hypothetical protein